MIWRFLVILERFLKKKNDFKKKNFFPKFFFEFLKIAYFEHNSARFEEKNFLKIWKKKFSKISHLEKSVILDTIFDFWLTLHTQTICLRSCYHVCSRNFYVTCIAFEHQHIWKCQFAVRYPVCTIGPFIGNFNPSNFAVQALCIYLAEF